MVSVAAKGINRHCRKFRQLYPVGGFGFGGICKDEHQGSSSTKLKDNSVLLHIYS